MKTLLFFICIGFSLTFYAQDSSFVLGNEAYANEDYETALVEYNKLIGAEQLSSALYFNLGNTYYKLDNLGKAIWAYERALKIDPKNQDVLFNLKYANQSVQDYTGNTNAGISEWLRINLFSSSINLWSILSVIFSILFASLVYLFFTVKKQRTKNATLSFGFGSFFLLILTTVLAYFHKESIISRTEAVVITEAVEVHTTPSESSPTTFKLVEGSKVDLLRSNQEWVEISVNEDAGWVEKSAVWEI